MKKYRWFKISLFIGLAMAILGILFKIKHWPGADILFTIATLISLIFIMIALMSIYQTENIGIFEKLLWLIGFILNPFIAGFIYYQMLRRAKYKLS